MFGVLIHVEVVTLANTRMWIGERSGLGATEGMRFTGLSMFTLPKRARPLPDRMVAARRYRVAVAAEHPEQVVEGAQAEVPQCHHWHLMGSTPIA
jgi:hypothetical protein